MKKNMFALAILFAAITASTANAGTWKLSEDGRYWYDYDDGSHAYSAIVKIDGADYMFDGEGYMLTGWQSFNGDWYYFDPGTGARISGWKQDGDGWYYLDPADGKMAKGFRTLGRDKYHFNEDTGKMDTGFFTVGGSMYFGENDPGKPNELGILYRNKSEREPGTNRAVRFDDEGRATYKNDTTEAAADSGVEKKYQDMLDAAGMEQQREHLEEVIYEYSGDLQDQLTDNYVKRVLTQHGQRFIDRTQQWEEKAWSVLGKYMSADEIRTFISSVESASFSVQGDGTYEVELRTSSSSESEDEDDEDYDYDYEDDWE